MAAQWPLIVNKLVTLLPTLAGWSAVDVIDGRPVQDVTADQYCTVGFVTSPNNADEHAGSYTQTQDPDGFQYVESGTVRCQVTSATGATDIPAQRTALFVLCNAVEGSVRADRTLGGVLAPASTLDLHVEVLAVANQSGSAVSAVLTFSYTTVT